MFNVNEPVAVDRLETVLANESGIFEAVSPHGNIFRIACYPDHQVAILSVGKVAYMRPRRSAWIVTRISSECAC